MVIEDRNLSTEEWEEFIGEQFRGLRLTANLGQAELAELADVSLGAIKNLEQGKGSTLRTLIRVARALGQESWLMSIAPRVTVSPIDMLRATKTPRSRVYRPRGERD